MMKKLFTLCLACMLCLTLGGCQKANDSEKGKQEKITDATQLLTAVWDTYKEDEKFPIFGGDVKQPVDNAPGSFDVSDAESLSSLLIVPSDYGKQLDDAAGFLHAMNANTFTAGAFHISDAKHTEDFIKGLKEAILNNQWMCGFPEKLLMFRINDDYVVSVFGNLTLIEVFQKKLQAQYPSAQLVVEEAF